MLRKDSFVNGEYYHLYNRGIEKSTIFKDQNDFRRFTMLLYVCNSTDKNPLRLDNLLNHLHKNYEDILTLDKGDKLVSIGAWCLMNNHFHILLRQEVEGGISKFMKKIGTGYSMYFNIKNNRQGALFSGPFKSKLIDDDMYLRHLFAYIHLNPLSNKFPQWQRDILEKNIKNLSLEKYLFSYGYSSYFEYIDQGRPEESIIDKNNFPDYFYEEHSFKNFISTYINSTPLNE